jgi:hypothetical protein
MPSKTLPKQLKKAIYHQVVTLLYNYAGLKNQNSNYYKYKLQKKATATSYQT